MVVNETDELQGDEETSEDEPITSPEAPTYSQEQVDRYIKDRNDTLAEIGRMKKLNEGLVKSSQTLQQRTENMLREQEEREQAEAEGEPDKLAIIRERQLRRQRESDLTAKQTELDEANARLQELSQKDSEVSRGINIREVASRLKVDPAKLAKLAKYTDGSVAVIEEFAAELPKLTTTPRSNLRVDSNDAVGGTAKTKSQIQSDFVAGKINNEEYAKQMKARGFQP